MTAARHDLTIDQGSDFALTLTVKEGGSAKSLSGWYAAAQMRRASKENTVDVDFDAQRVDVGGGKFKIDMPYARSAAAPAGIYHYDVEIFYVGMDENGDERASTSPKLNVTRLIEGSVNLRREATRV